MRDEEQNGPYRVQGVIYPAPETDPEYVGPHLREDEIPDLRQALRWNPVYFEHDEEKQIGVIEDITRGQRGEVKAHLRIDHYRPYGPDVIEGLRSSKLNGLSLGMDFSATQDYKEFSDFVPNEVSIVERGELDKTHILHHGDKKSAYFNLWGLHCLRGTPLDPPVLHTPINPNDYTMDPSSAAAGAAPLAAAATQGAPASGEDIVARLQRELEQERNRAEEAEKLVRASQKKEYDEFMSEFEPLAADVFSDDNERLQFAEEMKDQYFKKKKVGYVFLSSLASTLKKERTEKETVLARMKDMETKHADATKKETTSVAAAAPKSRIAVQERPEDRKLSIQDSYLQNNYEFESLKRMKMLSSAKPKASTSSGGGDEQGSAPVRKSGISWSAIKQNPLSMDAGKNAPGSTVEEEEEAV
jgi:hypothetical protein